MEAMNANNDWEKAKQAVDDAMGAVYDALHHLNEKVDELMQTPVVDEKKDEVCRKAEETVQNVSAAVEQFGQKLNDTLSSPEFAERTENLKNRRVRRSARRRTIWLRARHWWRPGWTRPCRP